MKSDLRNASAFAAHSCPIVTISTSATCVASSRMVGGHKKRPPIGGGNLSLASHRGLVL
nr:MAG TPA: hypothetical protein [Caudoviricetes sp.]